MPTILSFSEKNSFVLSSIIGVAVYRLFSPCSSLFCVGFPSIKSFSKRKSLRLSPTHQQYVADYIPIATINLPLTPLLASSTSRREKVSRYLKMMREENKRMQIETVW